MGLEEENYNENNEIKLEKNKKKFIFKKQDVIQL